MCQLVGKLLNYSADAECIVGSDRLESVQQVMLERVYDKVNEYDVFTCVCVCMHANEHK